MTRPATSPELTKLRSNGQWARWRAIIDRPDVLYTARATGAVAEADWSISFDGGAGTLGNCLGDMTLLVGSTSGGWERGIARLRKAPAAGKFYIGADSSIAVQDNDYLTVLNDFAPFARHPVGSAIDADVAYSDQLASFIPVAVMSPRIVVIYAGETVDDWDASGSWVPGSPISSYAWTFTGASSSTGTTTATPTATYNTSGRFRVALVVTAANGKTSTTYGWVYVLGVNLAPETGVVIGDPEGETGIGWSCQMVAYDRPTIKDRARVILYSEDYFDNVLGSAGPVAGVENQVVVGWIVGESIVRTPGQDTVLFTVGGPGVLCGSIATMASGLVDAAYPEDGAADLPGWAKASGLTIVKGLHYLINYRSTLARCIDIVVEDWGTLAHKVTSDSEDLWSQLSEYAAQGAMTCTSDRYGNLFVQRDARLYTYADRTADIPSIMTLTDADWTDELSITRRQRGEAAQAWAEGTLYGLGIAIPVGGKAPGEYPGDYGAVEKLSDVSWVSAAESLEVAGLLAGALNAEYAGVSGELASNNHFIDVAPRQYVTVTIDGKTVRCIPRRLVMRRRSESGRVSLSVDMDPEGGTYSADSITYPGNGEPEPGGGNGGGEGPEDPGHGPTDPPPPPVIGLDAVAATSTDVRACAAIDATTPAWTSVKPPEATAIIDTDYAGGQTYFVLEADALWRTSDMGATWVKVIDGTLFSLTDLTFCRVRASGGVCYVLATAQSETAGSYDTYLFRSMTGGAAWSYQSISDGLITPKPYTLDVQTTGRGLGGDWTDGLVTHVKPNPDADPWGIAMVSYRSSGSPVGWRDGDSTYITGGPDYTSGNGIPLVRCKYGLTTPQQEQVDGWMDDVFGAGDWISPSWQQVLSADPAAVHVGFTAQRYNFEEFSVLVESYVFWNVPESIRPTALDFAATNPEWVYVGLPDKILLSMDGGYTWEVKISTHGADDIRVHPLLAGVIAFWSATDGGLYQAINGVVQAQLKSGTALAQPLRINYNRTGAIMRVIDAAGELWQKDAAGTWTALDTGGGVGSIGIRSYIKDATTDYMVYGGATNIRYFNGTTWADATGDWSGYASPRNAHLLEATS